MVDLFLVTSKAQVQLLPGSNYAYREGFKESEVEYKSRTRQFQSNKKTINLEEGSVIAIARRVMFRFLKTKTEIFTTSCNNGGEIVARHLYPREDNLIMDDWSFYEECVQLQFLLPDTCFVHGALMTSALSTEMNSAVCADFAFLREIEKLQTVSGQSSVLAIDLEFQRRSFLEGFDLQSSQHLESHLKSLSVWQILDLLRLLLLDESEVSKRLILLEESEVSKRLASPNLEVLAFLHANMQKPIESYWDYFPISDQMKDLLMAYIPSEKRHVFLKGLIAFDATHCIEDWLYDECPSPRESPSNITHSKRKSASSNLKQFLSVPASRPNSDESDQYSNLDMTHEISNIERSTSEAEESTDKRSKVDGHGDPHSPAHSLEQEADCSPPDGHEISDGSSTYQRKVSQLGQLFSIFSSEELKETSFLALPSVSDCNWLYVRGKKTIWIPCIDDERENLEVTGTDIKLLKESGPMCSDISRLEAILDKARLFYASASRVTCVNKESVSTFFSQQKNTLLKIFVANVCNVLAETSNTFFCSNCHSTSEMIFCLAKIEIVCIVCSKKRTTQTHFICGKRHKICGGCISRENFETPSQLACRIREKEPLFSAEQRQVAFHAQQFRVFLQLEHTARRERYIHEFTDSYLNCATERCNMHCHTARCRLF